MFILKPHSDVPLYRQLADQIRRMIASGQLAPGASLPSIRDLAVRHAINPMTVSKVYSLLEAEGLLDRNRGKPMTVADRRSLEAPFPTRLEQLDAEIESLILAAAQLGVSEADAIDALRKRWKQHHD